MEKRKNRRMEGRMNGCGRGGGRGDVGMGGRGRDGRIQDEYRGKRRSKAVRMGGQSKRGRASIGGDAAGRGEERGKEGGG